MKKKLPDDWTTCCNEASRFYSVKNVRNKMSSRERDIYKKITTETDTFYLGIENQYDVNLIFPWRMMQMDCLAYESQIEEIKGKNRRPDIVFEGVDDFLYRYKEKDRLIPVVNLVLYWGEEEWERPLQLRDMLDETGLPNIMEELVEDYHIHLINMRAIPDEELEKMDSDLKYVLGLLKRTGARKKYQEYIRQNQEFFKRIPKSALDVLLICMNGKRIENYIQYTNGEETEEIDMCKALEDLVNESIEQGEKIGRVEGMLEILCGLVRDGLLPMEEAARRAEMTEEVFRGKMEGKEQRNDKILLF